MSKPKIEAIYPLTFMQQALLFHRLHEKLDEGFLQVHCTLKGTLENVKLQAAWQQTVQRHAVLRTSLHWEKIEKPVQIVHPQATLMWYFHDWTQLNSEKQAQKLTELKNTDRAEGLNLSKAPISRINLVHLSESEHYLLWSCHHILLDGWSAAIILKDAFAFYQAQIEGDRASLETLPSYRFYLGWMKRQDLSKAKTFWKEQLESFQKPTLIATTPPHQNGSNSPFRDQRFLLSEKLTNQLQTYARQHRITLNTLVQGVWAILLSRFSNTYDIAFGTTVSGRSAGLPNMELMAGLFTNVLPTRVLLEPNLRLIDWFKGLQTRQLSTHHFEYVTLDQIATWTNWPGHLPLFDSLFVFENFPWKPIKSGGLLVEDFKGGLTTTYPLTVMVVPEPALEINLRYNHYRVQKDIIDWLSVHFEQILTALATGKMTSIADIFQQISPVPISTSAPSENQEVTQHKREANYIAPRNPLELQLTKIWETLFGRTPIGVTEDFFHIGGNSLLAVRLFAQIEQQMGRNLPPVTLLQHRNIEALAHALQDENVQTSWSALVPMRASGHKPPLFCIHAGGAHVFFYNALAQRLDSEQPIYAIQPLGLNDAKARHSTIEEMATYYLKEIQSIQPEGSYALLGTCFSDPVCLEMARQLEAKGQSVSMLAIIDSAPAHLVPTLPTTFGEHFLHILSKVKKGQWRQVYKALFNHIRTIKKEILYLFKSKQEQNLKKMQDNLKIAFMRYTWKPFSGKVTFIRSQESAERADRRFQTGQWKKLANGGVDVFVIPTNHETMFEEPEVQHLAKQLQASLDEAYAKQS